MHIKRIVLLLVLIAAIVVPQFALSQNAYAPWGVDEYELLGLTKQELAQQFKNKLFFSKDWSTAATSEYGTGLGYQGATFRLTFVDGKVAAVQGVFVGCTREYQRTKFVSKRAALQYAIAGLSTQKGAAEKQKLESAQRELGKYRGP